MVETIGSGAGDYREKYRRALEEQERIEKTSAAQIDLLRKTLLRVSTAAQGLDGNLDSAIELMRAKFKNGTGAEIVKQLDQVQTAVSHYERNRLDKSDKAAKDVAVFIDNLLELQLPKDLISSLKGFKQGLNKRLVYVKNYPEILDELGKLQLLALNSAANPQMGFWDRLRGGKTLTSAADAEENSDAYNIDASEGDATNSEEEPANESHKDSLSEVVNDAGGEGQAQTQEHDVAKYDGLQESSSMIMGFDPGTEESYQQVASRIAVTLEGLVEKIEPNEVVRHKVDMVKLRIQRGMDWFVLAVTLEDIRDILLLRYLQVDQDFSEYLVNVNNQLHTISEALGIAVTQENHISQSAKDFSNSVTEHIGLIQASIDDSTDIVSLKTEVSQQLTAIQGALSKFNRSQEEHSSLSDQLVALVNKVKSIESESVKTKELLEEERYKATHDPLTELPNREAYNERAFHEMQRYKRYCRPLTMAVCDLDKFKSINDTYGHQAGDKVIRLVAKLLSTRIRKVDFVARFGGEEFVLLLPETTAEQAYKVLDKVRAQMAKTPFRFKDTPVQITVSFGLAEFGADDTVESVFERADKALYQAKEQGRNRCVIYSAETSET